MIAHWKIKFVSIATFCTLAFNSHLAQAQPFIQFVNSPTNLIVKLVEHIGEIDFSLDTPSLEIYGDGRVVVFYPDYMKRAGHYQLKLDRPTLDHLLSRISTNQIPGFDSDAAQSELSAAASEQIESGVLFSSSDPTITVLELNLDSYSRDLIVQAPESINRRIVWKGLRSDAKQFPDLQTVQSLYAVHQELQALMEHPDLVEIEETKQ